MSRKIVLKSVLVVVVLGFVLTLSSCQKDEKKIIGKWKAEKVEIKELSCSDPLLAAFIRAIFTMASPDDVSEFGGTIEFTKDGKAISYSANGTETATYKVSGNKLTIIADGESTSFDYSFPAKKTMLWLVNVLEQDDLLGALTEEYDGLDIPVTKLVIGITFSKQ